MQHTAEFLASVDLGRLWTRRQPALPIRRVATEALAWLAGGIAFAATVSLTVALLAVL